MQESFEVSASGNNYPVVIGRGLLENVVLENPDAIYMVDDYLAPLLPIPTDRRITIKATEGSKSLECMSEFVLNLREMGTNRSSHLVAIGGGVIQDVATFCASIYMRGIRWTYMPSTLLGMVDSCIGGKSSINVLGFKNLVGNIYPPAEVLIDVDFVASLDDEKIVGGLFEAVKICYAGGNQSFEDYLSLSAVSRVSVDNVQPLIVCALRTKKWFIETDEFDKKERLLLNFGHTFAHALESGTDFGVSHGIAVGLGMIVATHFSSENTQRSEAGDTRVARLIGYVRRCFNLISGVLVPPTVIDLARVIEQFDNDKKHRSESYRMVCPTGDGSLELVAERRDANTRNRILDAYRKALVDVGWSERIL